MAIIFIINTRLERLTTCEIEGKEPWRQAELQNNVQEPQLSASYYCRHLKRSNNWVKNSPSEQNRLLLPFATGQLLLSYCSLECKRGNAPFAVQFSLCVCACARARTIIRPNEAAASYGRCLAVALEDKSEGQILLRRQANGVDFGGKLPQVDYQFFLKLWMHLTRPPWDNITCTLKLKKCLQ